MKPKGRGEILALFMSVGILPLVSSNKYEWQAKRAGRSSWFGVSGLQTLDHRWLGSGLHWSKACQIHINGSSFESSLVNYEGIYSAFSQLMVFTAAGRPLR